MILRVRTQSAAFYSGHSGQSPLVLNHIEPRYKDKVGSVPRSLGKELSRAPGFSLAMNLIRWRSRRTLQRNFFRVVVGNAVDQQQEGIDPGFVRQFRRRKSIRALAIRDVYSIAVECLAVLPAFFWFGEGADVDPIIYRHLGLVALGVRFRSVDYQPIQVCK